MYWLIIICALITDIAWYSSVEENTSVDHKKEKKKKRYLHF